MTVTIQQVFADFDIMLGDHDPYVFGGISLYTGADCSGWIYGSLIKHGATNVPRTSQEMYAQWKPAPGPGYGIAVFFNVPQDRPQQPPQHVGLCRGDGTMAEEPHTGLDAEVVPIPNIPGVESIMGYRYLPVSYGPSPAPVPTPQPAPPKSTLEEPMSVVVTDPGGQEKIVTYLVLPANNHVIEITRNVGTEGQLLAGNGSLIDLSAEFPTVIP